MLNPVKVNADTSTMTELGITESVDASELFSIIEKANATGYMQARISEDGSLDISRLLID